MADPFLIALALKMVTSALIVVAASLVVERAGPFLGAMIATLPISAGPSYAFLAYEHGPAFVEASSLVSLAANAATALFIVLYAALAQRHGVAASIAGALAAWLVTAWTITRFDWSLPAGIALNVAAYGGALLAARRFLGRSSGRGPAAKPWWAVPARAVGVMCLVATVVVVGRLIGPKAAGMAALVPVVLTSLAAVLHPRIGGPATASVMANGLPGMIGFTTSLVVLHVAVVPLGSVLALLAALAVCVGWNVGLTVRQRLLRPGASR
ncbi:hypothetical protein [Salinarimonas soli]|uniref:Uncharacterized protein n=1 Tax=Salinarimonas soli TaxID=1638099 RepID=A0A5B2VSQ4_9HYPH|nr:hypothetical protein [Salinarimonas soli]KAA2242271.1 hypothetical protein F0L46_03005 [Salinarimonas soli]